MITVGISSDQMMDRLETNRMIGSETRTRICITLTAFLGNEAEDSLKTILAAFQANRSQRVGVVFGSPEAFTFFAQHIDRYLPGYKLSDEDTEKFTENSVLCFSKDKVSIARER